MKITLLKTYASPRVECVTFCTEQCMNNDSGNGSLGDLTPLVPIIDEGV